MSRIIFNGVTYEISQTRLAATQEMLQRFVEGKSTGVAVTVTHDGSRHHLYITRGTPITLIE
ncbi:hypothetical protein [Rhodococcus koreensis]|uniref:hypothetical protein n=1 Tax=Rhodococcus koreensis TaxID=99653 RepID=UPI00366BCF9D